MWSENVVTLIHVSLFRRGTAEKLRDQVKEAFSLPDAPQVLGPTLNFVGGTAFDAEDSFLTVSGFSVLGACTCTCIKYIYVNYKYVPCFILCSLYNEDTFIMRTFCNVPISIIIIISF